MKRLHFILVLGFCLSIINQTVLQAQSTVNIAYYMDNAAVRHQLNPALTPTNGYIYFPIFGSMYLDTQSNLGLTNFLFPDPMGGPPLTALHPDVGNEQFLGQLADINYIGTNIRLSLLGAGFYTGNIFWNLDLAGRIHANANIPKAYFEFLKIGMSSEEGKTYDIHDLDITAKLLGEVSLGASFPIIDDLRVGVKGKYLFGGARASMAIDRLLIDMRENQWSIETNATLNGHIAGLSLLTNDENYFEGEFDFDPNKLGPAGMGMAFDLGASYDVFKSFLLSVNVSASVLDLGMISWKKQHNFTANSHSRVDFTGIDGINFGENDEEEENGSFQAIADQFMEIIKFRPIEDQNNFIENLAPTLNIGTEIGTLNNKISLGLLFSNRFIKGNNRTALSTSLNFKPFSILNISTSYTLFNQTYSSIGVGLGLNFKAANIFLACDYIPLKYNPQLIPLTALTNNMHFGISVPLYSNVKPKVKTKIKEVEKPEPKSAKDGKAMERISYIERPNVESMVVDSMVVDSMVVDSMAVDSMVVDSMVVDSMVVDSMAVDSMVVDSIAVDSITVDSIAVDSILVESFVIDSIMKDSIAIDSLQENTLQSAIEPETLIEASEPEQIIQTIEEAEAESIEVTAVKEEEQEAVLDEEEDETNGR